jgi:uncharacterized membrane protein YedE/YeeE
LDPMLFTGIPVGLAFGYTLQRGGFCMFTAFRDIILLKDYTLLKAIGVALLVSMIGFAIMDKTGVISINPITFYWGALMLGGFIFGIGMVMAGGCVSGITYHSAEGLMSAWSAVVGFVFFELMATVGVFRPLISSLQGATTVRLADGSNLTLANIFGIPYYILALAIAGIALILWVVFAKREVKARGKENVSLYRRIFKRGWGWTATGIVIGLIGIAAFPASATTGRMYPMSISGGYWSTVLSLILGRDYMAWHSVALLSTIVGAFLSAFIAGEFRLQVHDPKTLIQTFFGGGLMGIGATLAGGCNVTHILSGVPQLALSSMLGGVFIILGCWAASWWMYIRPARG